MIWELIEDVIFRLQMRRRFDPDCLISGGRKILQEILCSVTNNVVGVRLCGPRPARTGVAWSVTGRGLLSPLSLFPARSLWSLVTTATTTRAHNLSPAAGGQADGWCRPRTGRPRLASLLARARQLTGSGSGLWLRGVSRSPSVLLLTPHPVSVVTPGQHCHRQPVTAQTVCTKASYRE